MARTIKKPAPAPRQYTPEEEAAFHERMRSYDREHAIGDGRDALADLAYTLERALEDARRAQWNYEEAVAGLAGGRTTPIDYLDWAIHAASQIVGNMPISRAIRAAARLSKHVDNR